MKFNLNLFSFLFVAVFLFSCSVDKKAKEKSNEAVNALLTILPKQDSTFQFDHFIFIDSTQTHFLDKTEISSEALVDKIKELKESKSNLRIQLKANENVRMDKLIVIMDVCKQENVELQFKSE